jgi:hypothetical protein
LGFCHLICLNSVVINDPVGLTLLGVGGGAEDEAQDCPDDEACSRVVVIVIVAVRRK